MKAIYFSDRDERSLLQSFGLLTTKIATTVSPAVTNYISYKFLFNPYSNRKYKFSNGLKPKAINLKLGKENLKLYFFDGGDKHILLTHGWGGCTKHFRTLIPKLLAQGYTVWAFDHMGHGHSSGKRSHLFGFVEGLDRVIDFIEIESGFKLDGVVGHSMGGVALMNLERKKLQKLKQIYIAVPVNFFELMFEKIQNFGISKKVVSNSLKAVSKTYKSDWHRLRPTNNKDKLNELSLFIHDTDDSYAPFEDVVNFNQLHTTKVVSTSGLGHGRILKDDQVFNYIQEHLRS